MQTQLDRCNLGMTTLISTFMLAQSEAEIGAFGKGSRGNAEQKGKAVPEHERNGQASSTT